MRKKFLSALLLCCMVLTLLPTAALAAGDVAINKENFPDNDFREYVRNNFDKNNDDALSDGEIGAVQSISVTNPSTTSLKGIEYFTNLESLRARGLNLTTLDLSKNTELTFIDCSHTKLTTLDTSHNKELRTLTCNSIPTLTSLNVSGNTDLRFLYCKQNALTDLNLTNNLKLEKLECGGNEFTTLDLSKNTNLEYFGFVNSKLSSLDLTNNTNLEELHSFGNNFSTLDVSKNTKLKILRVFSNKLIHLDTSKNKDLQTLEVHDNPLTSMYLGDNSGSTMEVEFNNNPYPITVSTATRTFNLSRLTGFDVSKAHEWENGTVNGNILTVDENATTVTYAYDCGERQAKYGTPTMKGGLFITCTLQINWQNASNTLTGEVNIKGAPKFGETLTAAVTNTNNTGTLTYEWYRAGKTDPIGTGESYTLKQADINKEITCKVSSSNSPGTIEKTVGPIEKADGPDAPVLELRTKTPTDILVTKNDKWEYSIDNGANWQQSPHFTNLQSGTVYTIIARVKETYTQKPSENSAPLTVTTLHTTISDELGKQLRAAVSAYKGEYDGMEHEAVIVDDTKMPEGWRIDGYTTDGGKNYSNIMPTIKNVGTLSVGAKFVHPDYIANITNYYTAEVTPKPLTNDMIADIPDQLHTGQPIHPKPEIKHGDMVLVEGRDFAYSYRENTTVGGTVNITGKGNYEGIASKSFTIVNEITEITEDDLKDLEIPTLVTVKCTTTNSSKEYGRIPGGFDLSKTELRMEGDVLKAIVHLNLLAYKDKYNADTNKMHEYIDLQGNLITTLTLKYVDGKWEPEGILPNLTLLVKCDDGHHKPNKPTVPEDTTVPSNAVEVLCTTAANQQQQSARRYGLLPGGFFTILEPKVNNDNMYECTITLIPETYLEQYNKDTGIRHELDNDQPQYVGGPEIQLIYNQGLGKWMPPYALDPLMIYVKCDNHQYTITFDGNGGMPSVDSMKTVDKKLPKLPTATHSGRYSFDGWYTEKSGGAMVTTDTVFEKSTTVYAHWTYTGGSGGSSSGRTYHTIKASSDSNGSISPSERVSVRHGRDQSFTITPNKGYDVAKVLVDGKNVGAVESYTFKNVTKNHTIEAIFMKVNDEPMPDAFMDVPKDSYYKKAVDWAVKNGITAGTGDNYFMPDGICTRAQAVTFLWRVAGSPAPKTEVMPFEDVPEGSYYYEAVLWAAENEITVGTSATTFSPELTCSRAHIVSFLWRAAGYPSAGTVNPFTDVPENAYYINAMLWAVKQEITVGTTPSTFSPDEGCTRAHIVTFLYRARSM